MSRSQVNNKGFSPFAMVFCGFLFLAVGRMRSQQTPSTLSVQVRRVAVDVVVKDSAGRPVSGLTQDDFRVMEDNKAQTVRSFEAVSLGQAHVPTKLPQLPPNTFSDFSGETQSGPLTVVLYDLLNTPLDSQPFARAQLLQFLKTRSHASPVAIFVLTDAAHLIQGFTDDDHALIAALSRQSNYKSAELLTDDAASPVSVANSTAGLQGEAAVATGGPEGSQLQNVQLDAAEQAEQDVDKLLAAARDIEASAFLDRRVEITQGALQEIAGFLMGLPGRKNLIWFSGSFPAAVLPDHDPNPYLGGGGGGGGGSEKGSSVVPASFAYLRVRNYSAATLATTNALGESHTAVYPVDARGLRTSSAYGMTDTIQGATTRGLDVAMLASRGQVKGNYDELNQRNAEQYTLDTIADATGGHAFYGTNGLADAANKAVDDGSSYYALTYQPSTMKADGALRQIKVVCTKRGYTLEYRRSYFAETAAAKPTMQSEAADPMLVALRRGAPPAHSLFFEAHLQAVGLPTPATAQQMEQLGQFQPRNTKGRPRVASPAKPVMMQTYAVAYGLLARQLNLTPGADGTRHAVLEFAALAYDRDGTLLTGTRSRIDDPIAPTRFDGIQQNGYETLQRIVVPVDTTTLRIGVRDPAMMLIGSTEIRLPLAKETAAR